MQPAGDFSGAGLMTRKFRIAQTVVQGQIVCRDATASATGILDDPASVNDYTEAIGITLEAGTYSTTQGTGSSSADVLVESTFSPTQWFKGNGSGDTTAGTALAEETDGNLLTNTSASAGGTVVTAAGVGSSDFIGGYMICLSGNNVGAARVITSHSDATSETVSVPFDRAIAVGDTFIRTQSDGLQGGIELTTSFTEFDASLDAAENVPGTGSAVVIEVHIDGSPVTNYVRVANPTAPILEYVCAFIDHAFNSVA